MSKIKKVLLTTSSLEQGEIDKLVTSLEETDCEVVVSEVANKQCEIEEVEDEKIEKEIEDCEIVFVLIGPDETENECIEKQIEVAADQERQVVGIFMGGATGKVPSALETYGDGLISNDIIKIKKVLEGIQVPWENPQGQNRAQKNDIDKGDC